MREVRCAAKVLSRDPCLRQAPLMRPLDPAPPGGHGGAETTVVDTALFTKLLSVASAASVFRQQYSAYYQRQTELVEQGHTLEELMAMNQTAFNALQRAEERLMAAVDALEDMTTP